MVWLMDPILAKDKLNPIKGKVEICDSKPKFSLAIV